jgi:hypothetical protein
MNGPQNKVWYAGGFNESAAQSKRRCLLFCYVNTTMIYLIVGCVAFIWAWRVLSSLFFSAPAVFCAHRHRRHDAFRASDIINEKERMPLCLALFWTQSDAITFIEKTSRREVS